jgi:hypothetical protein
LVQEDISKCGTVHGKTDCFLGHRDRELGLRLFLRSEKEALVMVAKIGTNTNGPICQNHNLDWSIQLVPSSLTTETFLGEMAVGSRQRFQYQTQAVPCDD